MTFVGISVKKMFFTKSFLRHLLTLVSGYITWRDLILYKLLTRNKFSKKKFNFCPNSPHRPNSPRLTVCSIIIKFGEVALLHHLFISRLIFCKKMWFCRHRKTFEWFLWRNVTTYWLILAAVKQEDWYLALIFFPLSWKMTSVPL